MDDGEVDGSIGASPVLRATSTAERPSRVATVDVMEAGIFVLQSSELELRRVVTDSSVATWTEDERGCEVPAAAGAFAIGHSASLEEIIDSE